MTVCVFDLGSAVTDAEVLRLREEALALAQENAAIRERG
jgi:hypothetical protein